MLPGLRNYDPTSLIARMSAPKLKVRKINLVIGRYSLAISTNMLSVFGGCAPEEF